MSWITTASNKHLDYLYPHPNDITIEDIASGLSNIPRWAGQIKRFYSVAEHCIIMDNAYCGSVENPDPEVRRAILLHDATEAYMGDIARPLKAQLPEYRRIEKRLDIIIKLKFGISTNLEIQEIVYTFDERALKSEALARGGDINWLSDEKYKDVEVIPFFVIHYYHPEDIKTVFLERWKKINDV
jgi:uncharacterized protein